MAVGAVPGDGQLLDTCELMSWAAVLVFEFFCSAHSFCTQRRSSKTEVTTTKVMCKRGSQLSENTDTGCRTRKPDGCSLLDGTNRACRWASNRGGVDLSGFGGHP